MPYTIFLICFGVGAGFVILSTLFGAIMGHMDAGGGDASFDGAELGGDMGSLDGSFDADFDASIGDASGSFDIGGLDADSIGLAGHIFGQGVSPFKPMIIATFLTIFGGAGLLMNPHLFWLFSVPLALFFGLAASFLLFRFVYVPLYKFQGRGVIEKQRLVGLSASVTESIPQGGFGKIKYVADGNRYTAPAKAEDGSAIPRGSDVQIMYIERNAFFVKTKF